MRVIALSPSDHRNFPDLISAMHRLRRRVFQGRLGWDVYVVGDRELDAYDTLSPTYLIAISEEGVVVGCARLLPTTGPTMLAHTFPMLLGSSPPPNDAAIFESSRFCVDTDLVGAKAAAGLHKATFGLLAGILEWGLSHGQRQVVTVTDVRFERILGRAGWPITRYAPPMEVGTTKALAGYLTISEEALANVRRVGQLQGPILVPRPTHPLEGARRPLLRGQTASND